MLTVVDVTVDNVPVMHAVKKIPVDVVKHVALFPESF
jgi:hypothetical protein